MTLFYALLDLLFIFGIYKVVRYFYRASQKSQVDFSIPIPTPSLTTEKLQFPYRRKDYLLTATEKNFYEVLKPICDQQNILVFAKVRLEDLVWIPKYTTNMLKWRGYVRSRHIDFVLCDRGNIKPLCAIELDDSTHRFFETMKTDKLKNDILAAAGLPLLRVPVNHNYDPILLSKNLQETAIYNNKI